MEMGDPEGWCWYSLICPGLQRPSEKVLQVPVSFPFGLLSHIPHIAPAPSLSRRTETEVGQEPKLV